MNERQKTTAQWLRRASQALEIAFLALLGLYLLYLSCGRTSFFLPFPWWLDKALLRSTTVVAVLRLLLLGPKRWEPWLSAALAALYYLVFRSTDYRFLVYLAVITAGCSGIDYRKILKTFLWTIGVFACVTVIAALTGAIRNYVYARNGYGIRSSWGFCYPTDFASIVLYLLLMLWAAWRKLPDGAMLFPAVGLVLLARVVARSDTSFLCGLLFVAAIACHWFARRVIDRRPALHWVKTTGDVLLTAAYPLCAVLMFLLMVVYHKNTGIGTRLDNLLSGRLHLSVAAWELHGLKAFGTPFDQIGNGFSTFTNVKYNFVDSSYPLIAMRYGWVLLLVYGVLWGWTIRRALRCGNRRLALAMGIIAVHCFSEHHFTELDYNVLLVMPFASFGSEEAEEASAKKRFSIKTGFAWLAAGAVSAAMIALLAVRLLPWLKTLFQAERLCGGGNNGWRVIGILLFSMAALAVAGWMIVCLVHTLMKRGPLKQCIPPLAVLLVCVLGLMGGLMAGNRAIAGSADSYEGIVEADLHALEIAADAATGKIYSDWLPEIYHDRISSVSTFSLPGEDMARYKGDTVLMDAGTECSAMFGSGFLYSRISDRHALYTDDDAVARALRDAGYSVTGYYSETKDVDMRRQADLNGLEYSPEDGLLLDGPLQSLGAGPYLELYDGKYTVTFDLQLQEGVSRDNGAACNLRVSSYWGETPLADRWISISEFDEDGTLTVPLSFTVWDGRGIEFLTSVDDGFQAWVRRIRYARTPDYDIHTDYDRKLRITRQEYYDLDGAPTLAPGNWFACDRGYDRAGNVNRFRYYDVDGRAILTDSGYAELHRTFNGRHQIVREEYFGVNGEPIALPTGQAAEEREYDADGRACAYVYYDTEGDRTLIDSGYAELRYAFDAAGNAVEETYYDAMGQPTEIGFGYSRVTCDYDEEQRLALVHYWNLAGEPLQAGSAYMHDYLQSLMGRDITLFLSVRDEATRNLTTVLLDDLAALGVQTDLSDKYHNSFYAVLTPEGSVEAVSESEPLSYSGTLGDVPYTIESAGYFVGNYSSIVIDGEEYSVNQRGINIVVYDNQARQVIDTLGFDTHAREMTVIR